MMSSESIALYGIFFAFFPGLGISPWQDGSCKQQNARRETPPCPLPTPCPTSGAGFNGNCRPPSRKFPAPFPTATASWRPCPVRRAGAFRSAAKEARRQAARRPDFVPSVRLVAPLGDTGRGDVFAEFADSEFPSRARAAMIRSLMRDRVVEHLSRDSTAIAARERPEPKRGRGRPRVSSCMTALPALEVEGALRLPAEGPSMGVSRSPRIQSASVAAPVAAFPG